MIKEFDIEQYYREVKTVNGFTFSLKESSFRAREKLVKKYSWAIPTEEAITKLIPFCKNGVVEVCAGNGYWARCLYSKGVSVIAFDEKPWNRLWFPVKEGSEEKAGQNYKRTLFLCWPPYDDKAAIRCLHDHKTNGGTTVIYVGEGNYGCTSDDSFHEYLSNYYDLITTISIPQWDRIHDYIMVYKLNENS